MKSKSNTKQNNMKKDIEILEKKSNEILQLTVDIKNQIKEDYFDTIDENSNLDEEVRRLKRATKNLKKTYINSFDITDEMKARWYDIKRIKKKRLLSHAPANGEIDKEEKESKHFAKGLNIYKLLLICFAGSFVGVVIEMLWCLIKNGYIESRAGLVYGPFNLLYGVGAVLLTLCLYKYRNRGSWISFTGGLIVGSILEYICSWGQELLIGSRSWDYSSMPFNINGRICLLYSVFWGFLGVIWIKSIYPIIAKIILKIPNKIGKIITHLLLIFFIFNILVTSFALARWTNRLNNIPPSNTFFELIDEHFPNERMEKIFANMEFTSKDK